MEITKTGRVTEKVATSAIITARNYRVLLDHLALVDDRGALVALHEAASDVAWSSDDLLRVAALAIACAEIAADSECSSHFRAID